jgi:hypothetical protein
MKASLAKALRSFASKLPDVEEGIACEGTALEKVTYKVRKKAFLFLGTKDLMLKLSDSRREAEKLAAKEPAHFKIGSSGWVSVQLEGDPPLATLQKWIVESHRGHADEKVTVAKKKTTAKKKKS